MGAEYYDDEYSRAPYGARGLKSGRDGLLDASEVVAPRMGRVD